MVGRDRTILATGLRFFFAANTPFSISIKPRIIFLLDDIMRFQPAITLLTLYIPPRFMMLLLLLFTAALFVSACT